MKRYSEYKDSGVKWIGEIPGHWDLLRAKNIFERQFRPVRDCDEVVTCFRDGQVTLRKNRRVEGFTESLKEIGYQGIRKGDLVIHQMDAFAGSIGVSDSDGKGTPVYICCLPKDSNNVNVYFYAYLLREMARSGFIKSLYRGIRERSSDFRFDTFAVQWLLLVPIEEQQEIVTYLDSKVAKIDEYISIAEKKIAALEELKQTIITEAVTRGIHKEVPMKDSGVKWIGMIPEHWKVLCLKYLSKIKGRIGYRGYTAADLVSEGEGAFVIGGKHINQCILNTESPDYISWDKYYESPEIMVSKGDIVMAQRGSLGKVALIDKEINEATINPSLVLIKDICCDASFLYFYLRSNSTLTLIELLNTATAVPMISQKQIEKMPIPLPPLPEQQEIVTYIEAKVAKIDQLCQAERSQIEKLKEYKQRLISDVVTGKVKVTND